MQLTDRYAVMQPIRATARADAAWWRALHDPVLDALVARAMSQNLTLAEARARLAEATAEARRAGLSDVDGDLDADLSFGGSTTDARFSLGAIFSPARRAEAAAAGARLDAARDGETNARRLVIGELARAYADLRFSQQLLASRHEDLRSRRQTLSDVTAQFEAQSATRLDTVLAQSLVAQTESEIPAAEAQIIALRNRLSTLLGMPAGSAGVDLRATGRQPVPDSGAAIGVPADLLRARPDIRQAERLYAAAVSEIGAAEAARYPQLSLSGTVRAPLDGGDSSGGGTFGLSLPIFSQPALAAGVDAAEARADQALIAWRGTVLSAVEEVESALSALAASRRQVAAAARVVELNREGLTLSRQLLNEGGGTTVLDILDRERGLSDARVALAQARRDVARDYIALYTALGLEDGLGDGLGETSVALK